MPKIQPAPLERHLESQAISEKQRKGRAANAVAELLVRKLLVPKVYMEPRSFNIDVLAVDRAGSGDIHGVHIHLTALGPLGPKARQMYEIFLNHILPPLIRNSDFHFKYVAVKPEFAAFLSKQNLFAEDGIGRVGIIEIIENPSVPPEARFAVHAERFRVASDKIKKFDNFQKKTPADMEFRG